MSPRFIPELFFFTLAAAACNNVVLREDAPDTDATGSTGSDSTTDASTSDSSTTADPPVETTTADPGTTGVGEPPDGCEELQTTITAILETHCYGCHAGGQASGGFAVADDLTAMFAEGYLIRGVPGASPVYRQVADGVMPLGGPPLPADQVALLGEFIADCTDDPGLPGPNEPPACVDSNDPISSDAVIAAIKADIASLDLVTAPSVRYLDMTYLHNLGYCDDQIEAWRLALSKAINSLSRGPLIIQPIGLEPERTIFRVDLRDYKWTPELWAEIVAANPYAITYESTDAQFIRSLTGADVFVQAAEWFLDATVQPPLYHKILDIPATRQELEQRFNIDVAANIASEQVSDLGEVVRAGVYDSGVSAHNRVFECHRFPDANNREYCLSHDFKSNEDKADIFGHPLDFAADGGEVIFTLANGLQGYMIVDAAGQRLNVAPIEVVADVEHGGEPVINGLSCMGCHTAGMRLRGDEVGPVVEASAEFPDTIREAVRNLYSKPQDGPDEMEVRLTELQRRFLKSLEATGAPERIANQEPISAIHEVFDDDVNFARAAAEFGVSEKELLKQLSGLEGLELLDQKPVARATFTDNFAINACRLNRGTTPACLTTPP